MGLFSALASAAKGAVASVSATGADFYLDHARRDDAELGAYLFTSMAYADGNGIGPDELKLTVGGLQSIFRNFDAGEINGFVKKAVEAHSLVPELGFSETEEKVRSFNDDAGNLKRLFIVATAIAKQGGLEDAEKALLQRFIACRPEFRPSDFGL